MAVSSESRIYKGKSMLGTFSFGDRLLLQCVPFVQLRPGDVVLYRAPDAGRQRELVHRILRISESGLTVRGDNNASPDPAEVTVSHFMGRVYAVIRNGRTVPILGGRRALWEVSARRTWQNAILKIKRQARPLGHGLYRLTRGKGVPSRFWCPYCTAVEFLLDGRRLVKYVWRGRTVARYWPEEGKVEHIKPYEIVFRQAIETRIQSSYSPLPAVERISKDEPL